VQVYLESLRVIALILCLALMASGFYATRKKWTTWGHVAPAFSLAIHWTIFTVLYWALNPIDPVLFNAWSATIRIHSLLVILLPVIVTMMGKRHGKQ
jgi:hypothetical protein